MLLWVVLPRRVSASSSHSSTALLAANTQSGDTSGKGAQSLVDSHDVMSIVPYSKGFIASCGKGRAFLFEKSDDRDQYRKIRALHIPADQYSNDPTKTEEQYITNMCISPSEETLLAVTNWQQVYQLVFSNIDVGKVVAN